MKNLESILEEVDREEKPSEKEREEVQKITEELRAEVERNIKKTGIDAEVRVEGSIAKDTWLRSDKDVDIFMLLPTSVSREKLSTICLQAAKKSVKDCQSIERYAEHPYLEALVEDIRVNIVPCYKVEQGKWKSATDRTPFHTEYVNTKLKMEKQKREIRLLKKFLKGIGIYGADIKTGGFSGYLCELLALHYEKFSKVLKASAKWKVGEIIDVEDHYVSREEDAEKLFDEPLIVIDPVDKRRNVASAVRRECLDTFRMASKFILKKPNLKFFYPPLMKPWNIREIENNLIDRQTDLVFLKIGKIDTVPDILWGQLFKTRKSISNLLKQSDFTVVRSGIWSDEKNSSIITFELENRTLRNLKKHFGPPVLSPEEDKFLIKYMNSDITSSGPWIETGRWVVLTRRIIFDVVDLLHRKLDGGGINVGVASKVAETIRNKSEILVNKEILYFYKKNPDFSVFLTKFLIGKPEWLNNYAEA
ncbi:MAG: CCA tRNA nucleotidyltransferase [Candidatus Bathyarchaeota archaeon]